MIKAHDLWLFGYIAEINLTSRKFYNYLKSSSIIPIGA